MNTKLCRGPCGRTLALSAFHRNRCARDGRATRCAECNNESKRKAYGGTPAFYGAAMAYRAMSDEQLIQAARKASRGPSRLMLHELARRRLVHAAFA